MKSKKRSVITVGRDDAELKIYTLRTRSGYESYQCAWYDLGRRQTKTFADMSNARLFAQQKTVALANHLPNIDAVVLRDVEVFKSCEGRLSRFGVTVPSVVEEWMTMRELLGQVPLAEAARFYQRHHEEVRPALVSEVMTQFLASRKAMGVSAIYMNALQFLLGGFAREMGATPIGDLSTPELDRFLCQRRNFGPVSRNNMRKALGTLFKWARDQGFLPAEKQTAASRMISFSAPDAAPEIWTPGEMRTLLELAEEKLVPFLAIAAFGGVRSAEIVRLEWSDVLWEQGYIEIKARKAKTKARRLVPLRDNLRAWLEPFRGHQGPVCSCKAVANKLTAIGMKAGIGWRQNALRHSYASYRLAENQDAAKTALELGNSPQMLFKHYRELVTAEAAREWFGLMPKKG